MKPQPKQFTSRVEKTKEVKANKKAFRVLKFSAYFLVACIIFTFIYTTYEFILTHDFRSPIIMSIQNPTPRKVETIESPLGSKSASLIQKVEAEEITNPYDPRSPKGVAWEINKNLFGIEHWESWELLGTKESGWNPYAINSSSGACGIPQSLPCSKMECERWDYECQIKWMANYIENRYGNPTKALTFHFEKNWY